MHPWCRNVEIFKNIDAGEGFGPLNSPKSLAGAISMPAAPRPGWGPGPPRRRIEITPAIFMYFVHTYKNVDVFINKHISIKLEVEI